MSAAVAQLTRACDPSSAAVSTAANTTFNTKLLEAYSKHQHVSYADDDAIRHDTA